MTEGSARSLPARIGIVALNLVTPGLGLLRDQRGRLAAFFLAAPLVLQVAIRLAQLLLPTLDFPGWATMMGFISVALVAIFVLPMVLSWRSSAVRPPANPWWARWYGMAVLGAAVWAVNVLIPEVLPQTYKSFYVPAVSMAPTLLKNDRLVADMRGPGRLRRGDIVMVRVGWGTYVKRVAALPGDRIELIEGVVYLNGEPVAQRLLGIDPAPLDDDGTEARRLSEQFPGEAEPHEIYDSGYSPGDDFEEQLVRPGHIFVLGDNRDHSADSRFPKEVWGVEQAPVGDVVGRALFYTWGPSGRMGEPLNH